MARVGVSKRLQLKVIDALRLADTPLTTSDVAMLIGRSYATAREALVIVGAERVDNSFPTEWRISGSHTPATLQRVPNEHNDAEFTIGVPVSSNPVALWNEKRNALSRAIDVAEITPESDPREIAKAIGNAAGRMAYLAYKLDEYATRPDWYDALSKEG